MSSSAALRSESELFRVVVVGNYRVWSNNGDHPGESVVFTRPSILFRPRRKPLQEPLVEPPGTAPGSDPLITRAVYRHSRQAGALKIGANPFDLKGLRTILVKSSRACNEKPLEQ